MIKDIGLRILAALIFFTRLPFWEIAEVPKEYYRRVVVLWPYTGILTGGAMALTFVAASMILPHTIAVISAIIVRLLITGALHEDGFADFCDGFGGGRDRQRILDIMKDSHIGSYGVIGLIVYYALLFASMNSIPAELLPWMMISADMSAKFASSSIINNLPYARKEEEAKNKLIYERMTRKELAVNLAGGVIGILPATIFGGPIFFASTIMAYIVSTVMTSYIRSKINGYTGDCCGAMFIISETAFYITTSAVVYSIMY